MKSRQNDSILRGRRAAVIGLTLLPAISLARSATDKPTVHIWKTISCECCQDWIPHLRSNGFDIVVENVDDTAPVRRKAGMPEHYASCHTSIVQGYAIEGHVPAREIKRLLRERPKAVGLAVPGMPIGAPGMDGPLYAYRHMPYDVLLIGYDGRFSIFQSYN
ncbi:DUF411 domain-containing protein [Burkholderia sp. Bp9126]|nr:DUF411 domain-containing protein [Burkholderia sp. Bp9126]